MSESRSGSKTHSESLSGAQSYQELQTEAMRAGNLLSWGFGTMTGTLPHGRTLNTEMAFLKSCTGK